jgi:glycosyltransferase involved in cell wall biosynthesis
MPTKVALIHDWLLGLRGGERVLEAICELYPEAEIFTLFHTPGEVGPIIERHRITASFLNNFPRKKRWYRHLLPLFPLAIERFDLSRFDLVISSSHCVAKGILPSPKAVHVCYCHTPMRYAWDRYGDYFLGGATEPFLVPFIHYLRMWDVTSSARVDHYVANSEWVAHRIQKYYRRESSVVNPFVDLEQITFVPQAREDYYLVVSAFAPYKRIDLAIEACNRLERRLIIVGEGQEADKLKRLSGKTVEFAGRLDRQKLWGLYSRAKALLFPGEEDFGITPLESMACGTPVIALARGGVTESVLAGETGMFFQEPNVESLVQTILAFEHLPRPIEPAVCRQRAENFSKSDFQRKFSAEVEHAWSQRDLRNSMDPRTVSRSFRKPGS